MIRAMFVLLLLAACSTQPTPDVVVEAPGPAPKPMATRAPEPVRKHIETGETLTSLLRDLGFDGSEMRAAMAVLRDHMDVHHLRVDAAYDVLRLGDGRVSELRFYLSELEYMALTRDDGISARKVRRSTETRERLASGRLRTSLHRDLKDTGHSHSLGAALQQLLGNQIDFRRLHPGSRYQVLYQEILVAGQPIGVERILGARIEYQGQMVQAFYFMLDGKEGYYDGTGAPLHGGFLPSPVANYVVSSPYTLKRFHPVLKRYTAHLGTDYAAPHGTPVKAMADGVVTKAQKGHRYNGNHVKIKHNQTYATQYLHLSGLAKGMRVGRKIKRGETLGYVGDTGLADGVHLCLRLWKNGRQVDPRTHLPKQGSGEPAGPGFARHAAGLIRQMNGATAIQDVAQMQRDRAQ